VSVTGPRYRQPTFHFTDEKQERCAEPVQSTEAIPRRENSCREKGKKLAEVSRNEIPNNQAKVELKSLLADLSVLKDSSTRNILSNKDLDYNLIPQIIKLNPRLTQAYIAQEIFGTICEGLGVSTEDAKTKLENLKKSKPQLTTSNIRN